jgi:hypothetical protein
VFGEEKLCLPYYCPLTKLPINELTILLLKGPRSEAYGPKNLNQEWHSEICEAIWTSLGYAENA